MKAKLLIISSLIIFAGLISGCQSTASFSQKLAELEKLGVTEVEITGKFSHTKFTKATVDGKVVSIFDHNNTWIPRVRIVRETPAQ